MINKITYLDALVSNLQENRGLKLNENARHRLNERNEQSAEIIEKALNGINENTNDKESGIINKTSDLFNNLSDEGYDVQVSFDNGESETSILLGQQGGKVIITINDPDKPLKAFVSGNFEINTTNIQILQSIQDILDKNI